MDLLPPEILRMICVYLNFDEAANVRFLSRNLSLVAAEFLVTKVSFHTSKRSLDRLEKIASHPVFSQTVRTLVYEAPLLADAKCRHEYVRHFELDHHGLEKPREPPPTCSDRERRLYLRNKTKWTQNIYRKYDNYRALFDGQRSLLASNALEDVLARCIPKFTKLMSIDIDPIRRCTHMTSQRFLEEFGSDCASPLSSNFSKITDQFKHTFLPNDHIITTLRRLKVDSLSPSFFSPERKDLLQAAFAPLTSINVTLKLADGDAMSGEKQQDCYHRHLSNGVLRDTLSSAVKLEKLSIGAAETAPLGFVNVSGVLSTTVWPLLRSISFNTVSSTQNDFVQTLLRQPSLKSVDVTMMQLKSGNWPETIEDMRYQLRLENFTPTGFLEDSQNTWPMDLLNVPVYMDGFDEFELGNAIEMYVTDNDFMEWLDDEDMQNPLSDTFGDFEDADLVRDMYGTLSELDDMSLDSLSDVELLGSDSDASMHDFGLDDY